MPVIHALRPGRLREDDCFHFEVIYLNYTEFQASQGLSNKNTTEQNRKENDSQCPMLHLPKAEATLEALQALAEVSGFPSLGARKLQ